MPWLVDGNNLLAQIPGRSRSDALHRRELASRLARWCDARRCRAILWFDGAPLQGWRGTTHLGSLSVMHSGGGRTADEAILDAVASAARPSELRVVTSDRALSDRCRAMGAGTCSVREFRSMLASAGAGSDRGADKPERVEPAEVDYFMDLFGGSDAPGESRSRRRR